MRGHNLTPRHPFFISQKEKFYSIQHPKNQLAKFPRDPQTIHTSKTVLPGKIIIPLFADAKMSLKWNQIEQMAGPDVDCAITDHPQETTQLLSNPSASTGKKSLNHQFLLLAEPKRINANSHPCVYKHLVRLKPFRVESLQQE